ncbi:tegument UL37 [Colobine gammaherpesvirus 1]|uniref:Tegument UL37 n=1 Tax=Colobine gammaherpesvirus 1 TaxID=2597325 RepID=A0A5B8G812_9GAMA|nr:tegument UL37 [Colobine gammaherpesvirus 1]QDQ69274.1 tegument UL37 [Colobine gammaherpesvirus 1]
MASSHSSAAVNELDSVTKNLLRVGGALLQRTKILIEMQLRGVPVEALLDPETLGEFLNTVASVDMDLARFIHKHPLFALMRTAYYEEEVSPERLADATMQLRYVTDTMLTLTGSNTDSGAALQLLDDSSLLPHLVTYTESVLEFRPPALPPTPPGVIRLFTCVEQLCHACFLQYWTTIAPSTWVMIYDPPASPLQDWLIVTYALKEHLPIPTGFPSRDHLARLLVMEHHELFVPTSGSTETVNTAPLGKRRALEIYTVFANNRVVAENTPLLAFTDLELNTLRVEYLFLYDFVIEAFCKGHTHNCSTDSLTSFLYRGIEFLTQLDQYLETQKRPVTSLEHERIKDIKYRLIKCGLSKKTCTTLRTMIIMSPRRIIPELPSLTTFMGLVYQLATFGHYFYQCLENYSPTGLARLKINRILEGAKWEQTDAALQAHTNETLSSTSLKLLNLLEFFLPKIPKDTLRRVHSAISSNLMRSIYEIYVKTTWGESPMNNPPPRKELLKDANLPRAAPTVEEIKKYCNNIQVGETKYDEHIVRSPVFAQEFTRSHLVPILKEIMQNGLQRNRAMFRLRWLIVFASDATPGLDPIRRPLARAYFHIMDILEARKTPEALLDLLDCVLEIMNQIALTFPDTDCPPEFLQALFVFEFHPLVTELNRTAMESINNLESTISDLCRLVSLGDTVCLVRWEFDSQSEAMLVPVEGSENPLRVPLEHFKTTIQMLERATKETLLVVSKSSERLSRSHALLVRALDYSARLEQHPLKIAFPLQPLSVLRETYTAIFGRLNRLTDAAVNSSAYTLTKFFGALFQSPLIPVELVRQLLEFDEKRDSTEGFLQSLTQPVLAEPQVVTPKDIHMLTAEERATLHALSGQFRDDPDRIPPSIKLSYSNRFDVSQVSIDWHNYPRTFLETPDQELEFFYLTAEGLRSLFAD